MYAYLILTSQKNYFTSPPPPKINIFNILHIQYQNKMCQFLGIREMSFYEKGCHVPNNLIVIPIPMKVNHSNNKTIE